MQRNLQLCCSFAKGSICLFQVRLSHGGVGGGTLHLGQCYGIKFTEFKSENV
jgi:hypothetical protein